MADAPEPEPGVGETATGRESASMRRARRAEIDATARLTPRERVLRALALGAHGRRLAERGPASTKGDDPREP